MQQVRNLAYIRSKDPRMYEALADIIGHQHNLAQQVNANPTGDPLPPPAVDGVTVTGQNGQFHVQIEHQADIYRGVKYFAEYADNAGFANSHVIHMGDTREHTQFLGNGTYYWRAYAAYGSSKPSTPAYHGGAANPQPVSGGGNIGGPALLPSQGSGTGGIGEGLSGPGPVPFRSSTGVPPRRGESRSTAAGGSSGGSLQPGPATGLPEGIGSLTGSFSGGGQAASIVTDPRTLTAPSTTINPPAGGALWMVILRQDATGGRTIAWGPGVSAASTYIDPTPNTVSTFLFAYDSTVNQWVMCLQPTTGMQP